MLLRLFALTVMINAGAFLNHANAWRPTRTELTPQMSMNENDDASTNEQTKKKINRGYMGVVYNASLKDEGYKNWGNIGIEYCITGKRGIGLHMMLMGAIFMET